MGEPEAVEEINYAGVIKVSSLLLCAVSQGISGEQWVCASEPMCVQVLLCVHLSSKGMQVSYFKYFTILQFSRFCMRTVHLYLLEVSVLCMFTVDHVKKYGNSGSSQLLLRD